MSSADLLSAHERCARLGFWARDWESQKLTPHQFLEGCLRAGLTSSRKDFGEAAGEEAMLLGRDRGLLSERHMNVFDDCTHLACIADLLSGALRKDVPWQIPQPVQIRDGITWTSGAFIDPTGSFLRRVCLVSSWSDDRHYSEARGWRSMGEICAYGLPLQQAVVILGQYRDGKHHGHWAKGLLHPQNKKLRFRKKNDVATGFKSSWLPIWREDNAQITNQTWISAMIEDGVFQDVCFSVTLAVPEKIARDRILDLAARKLDRIKTTTEIPDQQLSTCDWPLACNFRSNCHKGDLPSGRYGFVTISCDTSAPALPAKA